MSEWWTYRLADFLMFSPTIYWRLFESINLAWWPAQLVLLAVGLAWLGRQLRPTQPPDPVWTRAAAMLLAACWALVAWAFLLQRFAPIQWVASGFAAVFFVQALGLLGLAWRGGVEAGATGWRRLVGLTLGAWALLGYPLLGVAFGRPWQQAEVFGLAPDPTALFTLAWLLLTRPLTGPLTCPLTRPTSKVARWLMRGLWLVPMVWCLVSATTLWTLGSAQGGLLAGSVALALAAARLRHHRAA